MPSLTCCGKVLRSREDVLAHYEQVPFTGDKRPVFGCCKHPRRYIKTCPFCAGAKMVNDVDKSLWPRGFTLSDNLPEDGDD